MIGSDGFGYVFADGRHQKFPQLGRVIIEDDVEIGSNSTIDQGWLGDTIIGQEPRSIISCKSPTTSASDAIVSSRRRLASRAARRSGTTSFWRAGGISDKVRLEDRVVVGAQSGIPTGKIVRAGSAMMGSPARPLASFKKVYAHWMNLPNLAKKVEHLSRQLAAQSKSNGS